MLILTAGVMLTGGGIVCRRSYAELDNGKRAGRGYAEVAGWEGPILRGREGPMLRGWFISPGERSETREHRKLETVIVIIIRF